ncbi:MAG: glycosyltransferase family 2 protein [Nitrospirae bacterium]|nr:MAG: glycosyltransferase family 2 protein [Nitrospirota bacterium]
MTLSILIVSFNTKGMLEQCLQSIRRHSPSASYEVFVVDNGSTDGSPALVAERFPEVRLMANSDNRGFAAANNQALSLAKGEVILFLNSDTCLLPDSLRPLLTRLEEQPGVGIVGPTERLEAGTAYPTICPSPDLWFLFLSHTGLRHYFYTNPRINPYRQIWELAHRSGEPVAVDWLSGGSLMVRRRVLEEVGPFDEGYFFYMEDTDLCERARRAGWRIEYVPRGVIIHHGGGSSEKAKGGLLTLSGTVSELRYFRKHGSGLDVLLLKALLFAEYTLKLLLVRSSDPRRWAYREILRTILGLRPATVTKEDLCPH